MAIDFNTFNREDVVGDGGEGYTGDTLRVVLTICIIFLEVVHLSYLVYLDRHFKAELDKRGKLVLSCEPGVMERLEKSHKVFNKLGDTKVNDKK